MGTTVPSWPTRPDLIMFSWIIETVSSSDPANMSDSCETQESDEDSLVVKAYDSKYVYEIVLMLRHVDINSASIAFDNESSTLLLCCNNQAYFIDAATRSVMLYDPQSDPFAMDWISEEPTPGELIICGAGCGLAVVRDGITAWITDLPSRTSHQDGIIFTDSADDPTKLSVTAVDRECVIFSCASSKIIARYQKVGHYWQTSKCLLSYGPSMEYNKPCAHYNDSHGTSIPDMDSFSFDCTHYPNGHQCLDTSADQQLILVDGKEANDTGRQFVYLQSGSAIKKLTLSSRIKVASGIIYSKDSALLLCLSQSTVEVVRWFWNDGRFKLVKQMIMEPIEPSIRLAKTASDFVMVVEKNDTTTRSHVITFVDCE